MATSGPPTTWTNPDGLLVRFGGTEVVPGTVGSYEDHLGGGEVIEFRFDFGTDVTTGGQVIGTSSSGVGALADPNGAFFIPSTAILERVEVFVVKALVGGTSLSMGLIKSDYTTQVDATGLLAAEVTASYGTTGRRWIYTKSGGFLDGAPGTTSALQGTALGLPPGGATPVDAQPTVYTVGTFTSGRLQVRLTLAYSARDAILT